MIPSDACSRKLISGAETTELQRAEAELRLPCEGGTSPLPLVFANDPKDVRVVESSERLVNAEQRMMVGQKVDTWPMPNMSRP